MKQLFTHTHISKLLFALVFMIFFSCQQEEDFALQEMSDQDDLIELSSSSDHLVFNDYRDFRDKFEDLNNQSEDEVSDLLVQQGHRSLRPLITEKTLDKYVALYEDHSPLSARVEEDRFDFIGDDLFAALLNEDGEIIVNDSIYKYTPIGMFRAKTEMRERLIFFVDSLMAVHFDAQNGRLPQQCIVDEIGGVSGQVEMIDPGVHYYGECDGSGGGSTTPGTSGPGPTNPPLTTNDRFNNYLSTLSPCNTFDGWWPLGASEKCDEYFTDNSRVRTKIWNQDFVLWKSVGMEVKHQFKTGVWYNAKIDDLYLGVRSAFYTEKLSFEQKLVTYVPTSTEGFLYHRDKKYMAPQSPGSQINVSNWELADRSIPDGYDMHYMLHLPKSASPTLMTRFHIENTTWPMVEGQIKEFLEAKNINPETVGAILLTVTSEDQNSYRVSNLFSRRSDEKKLNFLLEYFFYVSIEVTSDSKSKIGFKLKNPFADLYAEFYGVGRRGTAFKGDLMVVEDLD